MFFVVVIFDAFFLQNCICRILFGTFNVLAEIIGKIIPCTAVNTKSPYLLHFNYFLGWSRVWAHYTVTRCRFRRKTLFSEALRKNINMNYEALLCIVRILFLLNIGFTLVHRSYAQILCSVYRSSDVTHWPARARRCCGHAWLLKAVAYPFTNKR